MSENVIPNCPECEAFETPPMVHRRAFIRMLGERTAGVAALGALAGSAATLRADTAKKDTPAKPATPAESLVKELFADMSAEQKQKAVRAWDDGSGKGRIPTRMGMYNSAVGPAIGKVYNKQQTELIDRIVKALCSGDDGFRQISRKGTWDGSHAFDNCGATIFGDPSKGQFAFLFTGHHLTIRCDGNSEPGAAFGGPMYYGHSPNGYSDKNVFNFQTKSVLAVFDALNEDQRKKAIVAGSPGEQAGSLKYKKPPEKNPGVAYTELTSDQQQLVEKAMRTILSPYRKEDAEEVMQIIKAIGGMEKIHLAFYEDSKMADGQRWHFWRLEGPGFVWNFRVLPHVHTFVYISSKLA